MNVLGLVMAAALRRTFAARPGPGRLRGALRVDAGGMRATIVFDADGARITRREEAVRTEVTGSLANLVDALAHRRLRALLRLQVRGSRVFALRAMRELAP